MTPYAKKLVDAAWAAAVNVEAASERGSGRQLKAAREDDDRCYARLGAYLDRLQSLARRARAYGACPNCDGTGKREQFEAAMGEPFRSLLREALEYFSGDSEFIQTCRAALASQPDHCDVCNAPQMVLPDGEHACGVTVVEAPSGGVVWTPEDEARLDEAIAKRNAARAARGVTPTVDTRPTPLLPCACGDRNRWGWHGERKCQHSAGVALPATASEAHRLADEFYNGTAEKDWPAWAQETVVILERAAASGVKEDQRG